MPASLPPRVSGHDPIHGEHRNNDIRFPLQIVLASNPPSSLSFSFRVRAAFVSSDASLLCLFAAPVVLRRQREKEREREIGDLRRNSFLNN